MHRHNPTAVPRTFDEVRAHAPAGAPHDPGKRRPNIVIWIMDDVGYGHLSPYGGLVDMPAMQRIADRGQLFSNFHVTPLCAPTRACLLTGRNHHTNHMGSLPRFASGGGRQDGKIPRENGFLSEILLEEGYATFALGKWHLTAHDEINVAASRRSWPLGRGFERFYGFIAGQSSQYNPHMVQDNAPVYPPRVESDGYHLSEDIVDSGIRYIRELRSGDLSKPFFMYLAFAAGHAPHHVPQEWMEAYRGKFDMGWDRYREIVCERQKALGILPSSAPLSAPDPDVPPWADLPADKRKVYARFMEAFAGMCTHMDAQVLRLMEELQALGELDDTIFLVLSDNGASSEGGETGAYNNLQFHGQLEQVTCSLENIDAIGTRDAYNHFPWGWAWAGNTPFRRWKRETYRGGCAVPLILSWRNGLAAAHGIRSGYAHAIDVVPSLLQLLGVQAPDKVNGLPQSPLEGTSFVGHLLDTGHPSEHFVQYDEMMGHRAIYEEGWRAVCPWPASSAKEAGPKKVGKDHRLKELGSADLARLEESGWELYHLQEDPAETRNLALQEPSKLRAMISRWWHEAGRYGVLPMMGAPVGKRESKPTVHVFYPDTAPVFIEAAPSLTNTDYVIEAWLHVADESSGGMLLAHGGRFGGYALMVRNGTPLFVYNYFGLSETVVTSPKKLEKGRHHLRVEFRRNGPSVPELGRGAPGTLTLLVDAEPLASANLVDTAAGTLSFTGMLTCGYHPGEPFNQGYEAPFRFDGRIERVRVLTGGAIVDEGTDAAVTMRTQ
jgi:arylsulfatase A-like enzyme